MVSKLTSSTEATTSADVLIVALGLPAHPLAVARGGSGTPSPVPPIGVVQAVGHEGVVGVVAVVTVRDLVRDVQILEVQVLAAVVVLVSITASTTSTPAASIALATPDAEGGTRAAIQMGSH